jgi:hypothetical protein
MLIRKVNETVFGDAEKKVHDAFVFDTANALLAILKEKFPARDMGVLKKYFQVERIAKVEVKNNRYNYYTLKLPAEILVPRNYQGHEDASLYDQLNLHTDRMKKANVTAREPYYKLIKGSTTWEQVIEVWPEAKKYQPQKGCVALIAVNPEVKILVQSDSKTREWK